MNKDGSGVALILLASVGYDGSRAAQYLLPPHLIFQPNWEWLGVGQSWLFPASSMKFLTRRSLKSRWVY